MQGNNTLSHLTTQAYELLLDRFVKKTSHKPNGCIEWEGSGNGNGYGHLRLPGDKGNKIAKRKAHRVSFMLFVGDIPEGLFVLHSCDNRRCVKPSHLRCGTREENMQECVMKGRHKMNKPMTDSEAHEAEQLSTNGQSYTEIAKQLGKGADIVGYAVRKVRKRRSSLKI